MPIWMQWVMAIWFVVNGVCGSLGTITAMRDGECDRAYMTGRLTIQCVILVLGVIALVYLIGGAKWQQN